MNYRKHVNIFARAQAAAFLGGLIDYGSMIAFVELLHIHYTISIAFSGIIGAIANFSINRYWTYKAHHYPAGNQLVRFVFVVAGSILLKSSGTYLLTTWLKTDYKISRIITDIFVSIGFNFTLQKYWVFRKRPDTILADKHR